MKTYREPPAHLTELTGAVIGAAIEVHRHLGPGFLESVYEEAMHIELQLRSIAFQSQLSISIPYKGKAIGRSQLDLLIDNELVVELKAVDRLLEVHRAQVISYLRATGLRLGLLINFHGSSIRDNVRRVIWDPEL